MPRIKTPLSFRREMRAKCLDCSSNKSAGEEVCREPTCAWYPFRFGKVYKRPLDLKMRESLEVFDFDAEWHKVVPVLDDPLGVQALDVGIMDFCLEHNRVWIQ